MVYNKHYHFTEDWESVTIGRAFYLHFRGYNADPAQFTVVSDAKEPLKGDAKVNIVAKTI